MDSYFNIYLKIHLSKFIAVKLINIYSQCAVSFAALSQRYKIYEWVAFLLFVLLNSNTIYIFMQSLLGMGTIPVQACSYQY